jgi:transposase InsO family protein
MREVARERPRFGYRRIAALLRREVRRASACRVHRLWRREGLKVPIERPKKRACGVAAHDCRAEYKNRVWCCDFELDRTTSGSVLKWLSIVDEHTHECLALKVNRSITSDDVIDTHADRFGMRGAPKCIRSDNGPEFVALAIQRWLAQAEMQTLYTAPGNSWENGFAETFHSRVRDEFLAVEIFKSLPTARRLTAAWKEEYNIVHPHGSLGNRSPSEFAAAWAASAAAPAAPALQQHTRGATTQLTILQPILS